jgi:hypothetical protein
MESIRRLGLTPQSFYVLEAETLIILKTNLTRDPSYNYSNEKDIILDNQLIFFLLKRWEKKWSIMKGFFISIAKKKMIKGY